MAYTQVVNILRHLHLIASVVLSGMVSAQQWHTTLEIAHPAEIRMPERVRELLLVNNTVAHPDAPMGAFFTLMSASEIMEVSDYLPSVLETSQNHGSSLYRKQLLNNDAADSLLRTYNSDALLVLNQQIVHPTQESYPTDEGTFYAYIQGIVACHWTLFYYKEKPDPLTAGIVPLSSRSLVFADTLYWEKESETAEQAIAALPAMEDVRNELFVYAGEKLARRFIGHRETVDRYLYDLGKDDPGMACFVRQQWEQAIAFWLAPHGKPKLDAHAAANCAVAYEIVGDLFSASAAADRAIDLFDGLHSADGRQQAVNMRYYRALLQARMAE